jgi:hypothetical protein
MEQKSTNKNYAKGIFLTKRKAKSGKDYLELAIKTEQGYDKYLCFESDKPDQFGNLMYSIMIKEDKPKKASDSLPF